MIHAELSHPFTIEIPEMARGEQKSVSTIVEKSCLWNAIKIDGLAAADHGCPLPWSMEITVHCYRLSMGPVIYDALPQIGPYDPMLVDLAVQTWSKEREQVSIWLIARTDTKPCTFTFCLIDEAYLKLRAKGLS